MAEAVAEAMAEGGPGTEGAEDALLAWVHDDALCRRVVKRLFWLGIEPNTPRWVAKRIVFLAQTRKRRFSRTRRSPVESPDFESATSNPPSSSDGEIND